MTLPVPDQPTRDPGAPKQRSAAVWTGSILMIASVALGILSIVKIAAPALDAANAPSMLVPGTQTYNLETGTYAIYERTGAAGGFSLGGLTTISIGDVT